MIVSDYNRNDIEGLVSNPYVETPLVVVTFNGRKGDVELTEDDVIAALGYDPSVGGGGGVTLPIEITDVNGLSGALSGKALLAHTHVIGDVTGLQASLDSKASTSHTHVINDVTGLQAALDGKQAAGSYAPLVHTHVIADVTGLQTALDSKQASGSYSLVGHTHVIADVTGLQGALDSKQASGTYYSPGGTDVALADGGTGASLADPNADRLMFWDDSAGQVTWLTLGTNLSITGTTIDAASGGGGVTDGDKGDIVVSGGGATWGFDSAVVTTFARTFLDDIDAPAVRTTLGLGTNATDSTARVPTTRLINTTAPLTGGGDLSADRTFAISAATTTTAGSMSAADKTKLDGVATGATANTGTVTTVSVATANGFSGTVANATTTPAITLTLGAGAVALSQMASVATGTVFYRKTTGTGAPEVQTLATLKTDLGLTGTNSGDQTITLTGDVTGSGTGSFATTIPTTVISTYGRTLVDDATAADARTTLGLGTAATKNISVGTTAPSSPATNDIWIDTN